jgi:hypothetical protein
VVRDGSGEIFGNGIEIRLGGRQEGLRLISNAVSIDLVLVKEC